MAVMPPFAADPAVVIRRQASCGRPGHGEVIYGSYRKIAPVSASPPCPAASLVCDICDIRHDLSHLHGLAGRHLLNAEDDLVIRRARRILEQFPKALQ
jgi:hypothetical protein